MWRNPPLNTTARNMSLCRQPILILTLVIFFTLHIAIVGNRCSNTATPRSTVLNNTSNIVLFVGVLSRASNFQHRNTVRNTWGRDPDLHRVLFFVARPENASLFESLRHEAVVNKDVVIVSHVQESYHGISHQTFEIYRSAYIDGRATHVMKVLFGESICKRAPL